MFYVKFRLLTGDPSTSQRLCPPETRAAIKGFFYRDQFAREESCKEISSWPFKNTCKALSPFRERWKKLSLFSYNQNLARRDNSFFVIV